MKHTALKCWLAAAAIMAAGLAVHAEELNCKVEVNAQKVSNANKEIFKTLEEAMNEYMNTTQWTDAQFAVNEKIECKLFFVINSYDESNGKMSGDLQIQSMRPVYNSSYTTTVINFKDAKIDFFYQENEPLVFNEMEMQSNLTAILNFWAYMIIALDCETFAPQGGDPYFEKAATVVRLAQSTNESGWKAFEDTKNRSAVLSAYTDKATSDIRTLLYNYHRNGLDIMVTSPDKGRSVVTQCITTMLKKVYDAQPMSVCLSMFKDAKLDELVNIYSKGNSTEKENVYEVLYALYPTELERLNKIKDTSTR